jgi:hypothetical protein
MQRFSARIVPLVRFQMRKTLTAFHAKLARKAIGENPVVHPVPQGGLQRKVLQRVSDVASGKYRTIWEAIAVIARLENLAWGTDSVACAVQASIRTVVVRQNA